MFPIALLRKPVTLPFVPGIAYTGGLRVGGTWGAFSPFLRGSARALLSARCLTAVEGVRNLRLTILQRIKTAVSIPVVRAHALRTCYGLHTLTQKKVRL